MAKKIIVITILMILISSIVSAEGLLKMRVLNDIIKDKPEDLPRMIATEFVSDTVRDANGEVAAMIKIISDVELAGILPANRAVKDVEVDASKVIYKVYVQRQERKITITAKGYEPLTIILYDYGIRLEEGKVYQIKITGEKKREYFNVSIVTTPENAEKIIDGESVGNGSTFELTGGEHILKVVKEGKKSFEKKIKIEKTSVLFKDIILRDIEPVGVTINSKPDNADIILDNVDKKKKTNRAEYMFPGKHIIELKKEGYLTEKKEVYIEEQEGQEVNFELTKNVVVLNITKYPMDAKVTIDGKEYQKDNIEIKPGKYLIEVEKRGYISQSEKIDLEFGKKYEKEYRLVKNEGNLEINVKPEDAVIKIDKETINSKKVDLPPGMHKIEIERPDFYKFSENIQIEAGKSLKKNYELKEIVGNLRFNVTPTMANAELIRDGVIVEKWKGIKQLKNMRIGKYILKVESDGYEKYEEKIVIKENELLDKEVELKEEGGAITNLSEIEQSTNTRYDENKNKVLGKDEILKALKKTDKEQTANNNLKETSVRITTIPKDVNKIIDKQNMGTGEVFNIKLGEHNLKLTKEGYKSIEKEIDVQEGSEPFEIVLEKAEAVEVVIRSKPNKAEIYINDKYQGITDKILLLVPGKYKLEWRKEKYMTVAQEIEVMESGGVYNSELIKNTESIENKNNELGKEEIKVKSIEKNKKEKDNQSFVITANYKIINVEKVIDFDITSNIGYGVKLAYKREWFRTDIELTMGAFEMKASQLNSADSAENIKVDMLGAGAGLYLNVFDNKMFEFYCGGGYQGGYLKFKDYSSNDIQVDTSGPFAKVGLGVSIYNFYLTSEYKKCFGNKGSSELLLGLGITF